MWYVKKSEILSLIPHECLDEVLHIFSPHMPIKKNVIIYHPNDPSDFVYMIKKGSVQLTRIAHNGQQITLNIVTEGMIFGEGDVLNEKVYTHYAETLETSQICYIRKDDFQGLLAQYRNVNNMMLNILHRRWKEAQIQIENLAFYEVHERLANILLRFSAEYGMPYNNNGLRGTLVNFKVSQDKLGDFCGTSRESINRNLKDMKAQGLLEFEGRRIVLLDSFFDVYSGGLEHVPSVRAKKHA
ncbi:Crp/Fnr family transcriptional regulator [Paenibacillus humicola]|uniref:Crp/Fnr family transcriptional regulator n=1 Tax=Paenibacillus humicola TaxID=3110540 RepID=UPI00237C42BF|nr:Crp/Fnr family transcriptional regulator [Paenibacillus humicola]